MNERSFRETDDAIAIVGLACRLPGAPNPAAFWRLLREGTHAIIETPAGRWDSAAPPHPQSSASDQPGIRFGGFLDDIESFDPEFFGISPREARAMDPQQRLMLELSWEVLEDACIVPEALRDSRTGVFVGAMWTDYATLLHEYGPEAITQHTLTGLNRSIIANRISYNLGLHGPSLAVDGAQSSSLVAVHLACESLRTGESTLALAGGVNLNILAESTLAAARFGGLCPDGRCFTFDARANGYVRGEGGAVVALKTVARALTDGDRIYAVIKGSAVNNDGATDGLTVPSSLAQQDLLHMAYERAGVERADVQYVELHGTGTKVGDPIEAAALGHALGTVRPSDAPLLVGSAKTNVGHLEGAAGVVGLLKTVLSIQHRTLVPSLNYRTVNPSIPLADLNLEVNTAVRPWPCADQGLIAGVSSFGMGGTNCHIVLTQAPPVGKAEAFDESIPNDSVPLAYPISGKTDQALRAQAAQLESFVQDNPQLSLPDLGFSLATTRTGFSRRAVVIAEHTTGLRDGLHALALGEPAKNLLQGTVSDGTNEAATAVFMFTGQGSQRPGMGAGLYRAFPVFATALDEACAHLDIHLDRPLREVIFAPAGTAEADLLSRTGFTQPALFAIEVALFRLLRSYGLEPAALIGHSVGEITAAHVAGVLSLGDASSLITARGRLMESVSADGAMFAVEAAVTDVLASLVGHEGDLSVAAVNSPTSTIISGTAEVAISVAEQWRARGHRIKRLAVSHAFHSPHMDSILDEFRRVAAGLTYHRPSIPVVSNVTGLLADHLELCGPDYWVRHARQPVQFSAGLNYLHSEGFTTFLELGPDATLATMGGAALIGNDPAPVMISTLRRGKPEQNTLMTALGRAYSHGLPVDWASRCAERGGRRISLPTYPFQRQRYWPDTANRPKQRQPNEVLEEVAAACDSETRAAGLAPRLAGLSRAEGEKLLLELVVSHAATVLEHDSPDNIDPRRSFKDQGFDSLTEIELCNRLAEITNQQLPSSLVFNYPNPAALARHLRQRTLNMPAPVPVAPTVTGADTEPVAIVGVGCRFPGMIANASDLWRVVVDGVDATSSPSDERGWRVDELYDPDLDRAGTISVRRGGFLENVSDFDREFFDISAREAMAMDPQQRLLLEVAWETLENAGVVPSSLRGSDTGVFVGVTTNGYERSLPGDLEGYLLTGSTGSVASGRIAYCFGLEGPAVTLDTACSSSLVALHQARRAIEAGDCTMALAGGVTVMANPDELIEFSRLRALSPDGRCKAFSADADGVGLGEGAGMVLLERVSDALRNGHRVLAVIRGSAINQDGASNGLTAPNGTSQERLLRAALASARLTESDVDVVEAHGTGTLLGDPVEAHALMATYGAQGRREHPLWLGSVKSNIGHAQAAAGVAGVIKMVEAIRHGVLPPTLYATEPTPHVNWATGALRLLTEQQPWPEHGHPRRAGISSFGVSGTNAHLIIEQAPATPERPAGRRTPGEDSPSLVPWPISAKSVAALREQATRLHSLLTEDPSLDVVDVGFSLATTRDTFDHRAVILGRDREEFLRGLDALAGGRGAAGLVCGTDAGNRGGTVFVFPGQGSEWPAMGRELWASSPTFREQMRLCARALEPWTEWSLLDVIRGVDGAASLNDIDVVQPALFAMMVSLAAVWRGLGVRPDAVVGTSQGELAAACVAGALSLDEAARIVALRAKILAARLTGEGGLASVVRPLDEVLSRLARFDGRVVVAGVNGPEAITVAGDRGALDEFITACVADGLYVRRVAAVPAHSRQVDVLRAELLAAFGPVTPRRAELPFYSSVTGKPLDTTGLDTEYWYSNLREPVNFQAATHALDADGHRIFLEMSPQPVLALAIHTTFEESGTAADSVVTVGSLRRNAGGIAQLLASVSKAYVHGATVDWSKAFPEPGGRRISLPTYPFQRQTYWMPPGPRQRSTAAADGTGTLHPILDTITELAGGEGYLCTGSLSAQRQPWLVEHTVAGAVVLPGTGLLELALRAGTETGYPMVEELTIHSPVLVPTGDELTLQLRVAAADDSGRRGLSVHTRAARTAGNPLGEWTHHATGTLARHGADPTGRRKPDPGPWPPEGVDALEVNELYSTFDQCGIGYGPAFHGIRAAWSRDGELFAELALPTENQPEARHFGIHPALLDAAMQVCLTIELTDRDDSDPGNLFMPFTFTGVRLYTPGVPAARVHVRRTGPATTTARLTDESGAPVADVEAMVVRPILARDFQSAHIAADQWLFELNWIPLSAGVSRLAPGRCAVVCDNEATDFPTAELGADSYPDLMAARAATRDYGPDAPSFVLLPCLSPHRDESAHDTVIATYAATQRVLGLIKDWLDAPEPASGPLVVLTRGAVAAVSEDVAVDLVHAPLWGLIRSAQEEHSGHFVVIDIDDDPASMHALLPAVGNALSTKEFQLVIRHGSTYIPRLARATATEQVTVDNEADPNDTVLITGGTGALGRILARHLVIDCGKRQLILASRRGPAAQDIAELQAELGGHGATIRVVACDAADRAALARLLDSIPTEHPLTTVIHTATTFDDVAVTELTKESLETVMRPKVDAVLNLHELTRQLPLTAFVLFSSLQGILGGPGRAGYAAANTFLDAMARYRLDHGQPALSIAWGWWAARSTSQGELTARQLERTVQFLEPLSAQEGMALFDLTQRAGKAVLVAARINLTTAGAAPETVPAPLRGLLPAASDGGSTEQADLETALAQLTEDERHAHLADVVITTAATVIGVPAAAVPADRAFRDLGLDSLMAVQLRQRLAKVTGLRLRATVAFDHPTANALARHLRTVLLPGPPVAPAGISQNNDRTVAISDQFDVLDAASLVDLALGRHGSPDQRRPS